MAIPDFQTMMRPLLDILADKQDHPNAELYARVGDHFGLSEEDRAVLIESRGAKVLNNRVAWSLSHFKYAGLVDVPQRGVYKITERGLKIRNENPQRVDLKVLNQFPEHVAFRTSKTVRDSESVTVTSAPATLNVAVATPDEAMAQAYQEMRASLAQELLEKMKQVSPAFFERLVVDVLLAMGYGGSQVDAGQALGRSGDGGLDGVIREDKLGLDVIYLQAKRWEGTVGRPVVQGFVGAIHGARATKGVIITTSDFSVDAKEYVKSIPTRIVLVDGRTLAELMIDHNVAVSRVSNYDIKKVDNDYFADV